MADASSGWEAVADRFATLRSDVGTEVVLRWAAHLPPGGEILDIGCGTGVPIGRALRAAGFALFGVDPSPTMLAAYRRHVPDAITARQTAEDSDFFERRFDGIVAIGLVFLLSPGDQHRLLLRLGAALRPGGRFLFSAPRMACAWNDSLTGRASQSLGEGEYARFLVEAGMRLVADYTDEGGNHCYHAVSTAGQA